MAGWHELPAKPPQLSAASPTQYAARQRWRRRRRWQLPRMSGSHNLPIIDANFVSAVTLTVDHAVKTWWRKGAAQVVFGSNRINRTRPLARQCRITLLIALKHIDLKTWATFATCSLLDNAQYRLANGSESSPQIAMFFQKSISIGISINLRTKHISIWNKKRVCCFLIAANPSMAGGADGTRTRDPRRDRPVF